MKPDDQGRDDAPEPGPLPALLRRNGWAMGAIASATVLVDLGVYAAGRLLGIGAVASALAALATAAVWTALAAPAAAAGGRNWIDAMFRGGTVADASGVALVVLWLIVPHDTRSGQPYLTFLAIVKIYCTLAAMSVAAVSVVCCARTAAGRHVLGVTVAVVFILLMSSLLWASVPLAATGPESHARVAAVTLWVNPFWSIGAAVVRQTGFDWYGYPIVYRVSRVRDYSTPNVPWYASGVSCLCAAGLATGVVFLRRRRAT